MHGQCGPKVPVEALCRTHAVWSQIQARTTVGVWFYYTLILRAECGPTALYLCNLDALSTSLSMAWLFVLGMTF